MNLSVRELRDVSIYNFVYGKFTILTSLSLLPILILLPIIILSFAPVQTGLGAHPATYTTGTGSFPGVKRPARDVDYPTYLALLLKKE